MKTKIFHIFSTIMLLVLFTACSVTQEMKEGVTFKNLTKYYIETPKCQFNVFETAGGQQVVDDKVKSAMEDILKEKGFERVSNIKDAQIIFQAIWNVTEAEMRKDYPPYEVRMLGSFGTTTQQDFNSMVNLEIQAYFPNRDDWVWRGFSPIDSNAKMMTTGVIKNQVHWCLEYFPPDKYPSNLEEKRSERAEKKYEEKNTFNSVLIEERKKKDITKIEDKNSFNSVLVEERQKRDITNNVK